MRALLTLILPLLSIACWGQSDEHIQIGNTIDKFLTYLSFADSTSWKVDSLPTVFVTDGKLTANFGKKPMVFTVAQYIDGIRNNVSSGKLYSSTEKELARRVDVFGKIAHVLSTYELTMIGKEGKIVRRGINSIQLLKLEGKWLIWSLVWDRESDTLKLPPVYLKNK
jgi:hypothetical protein